MDYYEPRDSLDEPPLEIDGSSPIQKLFEGAHIFITGASGFMGKVLMEKILRTCNVAQIYILVRDKKGTQSKERLASILDDELFDLLKIQKPGEVKKIKIVTGDCSLSNLGLSAEDKMLLSHVSIIYHAAATLAMDQHIQIAYKTNVLATRFLLEFAKTLTNLRAFMYISTAYTHAYRDLVEEKFYSVVFDENEIDQLCNQLDAAQVGALTPKLIGRWTNTYALTKACAENLLSKYEKDLPIGVLRPSIVVSTRSEPLQGWINNVYGAVGVVTGTGMGLLRLWCADPDMQADMIPVDYAINMTMAATWEVAVKNTELKIYNLVVSPWNPITYDILRTASFSICNKEKLASTKCIAFPQFFLTKNKTMFFLYSIWYHVLPAILFDIYLNATGSKIRLKKVYAKVYNVNKSLMPYCLEKNIVFTSDNVIALWDSLDPIDKRLFDYDMSKMNWGWFWLNAIKGMRVYLLKDPVEALPEAHVHCRRLHIRKIVFDSLVWFTLSSMAYFAYNMFM